MIRSPLDRHEQVRQGQLPAGRARRSVLGTGSRSRAARAGSRCCRPVPPAGARPRRTRAPGGPPPRPPGCAPDELAELVVGVAEAAEQPGAGRPRRRVQHHLEVTVPRCFLTVGRDRGQHLERVGERRGDIAGADSCGLGCSMVISPLPAASARVSLPSRNASRRVQDATGPGRGLAAARLRQRRPPRRPASRTARNPMPFSSSSASASGTSRVS